MGPDDGRLYEKVFVYGSLRRGQKYRYLIDAHVVKEQSATIRGEMYHYAAAAGGQGEFPYLTPGDDVIQGEVLTFRDFQEALRVMDRLEGYPEIYVRRVVPVEYTSGGKDRALVYFIRPGCEKPGRRIASGDWLREISP